MKFLRYSILFLLLYAMADHTLQAQFVPRQPDYVYKPNIRFPEIFRDGSDLSQPVIELNTTQKLLIRFDDTDQGSKTYSYRVIHCTADWQPSDLLFMQYMQGFEAYDIFDFHFSSNCTQPYTHYEFKFPNEYMRPTIPGNFLMVVYENGDPEDVVFTRRFMVVDNKVTIDAKVRNASNVEIRSTHQEVYFTVNVPNINIQDYYNDLKVVITQNNRWDNAITDIKPQFISTGKVQYNFQSGENAFPGGNQYRFIDLKTIQLVKEPILRINFDQGRYHILLRPDLVRNYRNFQLLNDINGKYVVYNQDTYNTRIDPDYAYVYFSIPMDEPLEGGDIYLTGGFTFGELLDQYRMEYNPREQTYELVTQLKQGYYNYMYAFKKRDGSTGDLTPVEGSFAECENDYAIYVYVRQPGDITHKLVGLTYINSFRDR